MATLHFTKGQGTGNDFVLYSDPDGRLPLSASQIAAICDRHFGIGADGVIRAVRSTHLPEGAEALAEDDPAAKTGHAELLDCRLHFRLAEIEREFLRSRNDDFVVDEHDVGLQHGIGRERQLRRHHRLVELRAQVSIGGKRRRGSRCRWFRGSRFLRSVHFEGRWAGTRRI